MFNTIVALGSLGVLFGIGMIIFGVITKQDYVKDIRNSSHYILTTIFILAVVISMIYSNYLGYAPCVLCWYQRIPIFGILFLSFVGDITKDISIRKAIRTFAWIGLIPATIHVLMDYVPSLNIDVCGIDGISCSARYVYEFGFVTVPLMSFITLVSALVLTYVAGRYPQK
jgi:disulfide bond formation protein DsbB